MSRCVHWVLLGSVALIVLAGCGRNLFVEREAWRHVAEEQCLKSGTVRDGVGVTMIRPIEGPGICGADFPLKVDALGDSRVLGYDDELRPPGSIPRGSVASHPSAGYPVGTPFAVNPAYPVDTRRAPNADYRGSAPPAGLARGGEPISLSPPSLDPPGRDGSGTYATPLPNYGAPRTVPSARAAVEAYPLDRARDDALRGGYPAPANPQMAYPRDPGASVPMSPSRGQSASASIGPAAVTPNATLACPIVSALDHWIVDAVQPSAQRWFAQPVVEIRQISAYSCRGMNGQPGAHISEHAFGNALDVAAFKLADGHVITVMGGWHGTPEEQGFLHDVQLAACEQFTTVLAPGSNVYHYDHIHVDLMRRASGRRICQPAAIPGDVVAARVRARYAGRSGGEPSITGSISPSRGKRPRSRLMPDSTFEDAADRDLPRAVAGED
jgi:hypothetical protein